MPAHERQNMSTNLSYLQGMFAREDYPEDADGLYVYLIEVGAACFHEAGHAAAFFTLGKGLRSVSVTIQEKDGRIAFGGLTERHGRRSRLIYKMSETEMLIEAIVACAGPMAEIRFRKSENAPLRTLGATDGDHAVVDRLDKVMWRHHGRSGHSLSRLAWCAARKIIGQPQVWAGVCALAHELQNEIEYGDDQQQGTLPGRVACEIFCKAGITPKRIRARGKVFPLKTSSPSAIPSFSRSQKRQLTVGALIRRVSYNES
jgi:hypothetical protein